MPQENLSSEAAGPVEGNVAAVETDKLSAEAPPVPENVVAPSEVIAEVTRETTHDQPRDEDTVIVSDTAVLFTPAVIYSGSPTAAAESAGARLPRSLLPQPSRPSNRRHSSPPRPSRPAPLPRRNPHLKSPLCQNFLYRK